MATKRKSQSVNKASARKLEGVADLFSKLEVEAEKVIRRLVDRAEQSSKDLRKGIFGVISQLKKQNLASVANAANDTKEDLLRMAEDVVAKVREIQQLTFPSIKKDELIRDARRNLDEVLNKINHSEIFAKAKVRASVTKDSVFTFLSIPSQTEVVKLSRKISALENRIVKLTKKAA